MTECRAKSGVRIAHAHTHSVVAAGFGRLMDRRPDGPQLHVVFEQIVLNELFRRDLQLAKFCQNCQGLKTTTSGRLGDKINRSSSGEEELVTTESVSVTTWAPTRSPRPPRPFRSARCRRRTRGGSRTHERCSISTPLRLPCRLGTRSIRPIWAIDVSKRCGGVCSRTACPGRRCRACVGVVGVRMRKGRGTSSG